MKKSLILLFSALLLSSLSFAEQAPVVASGDQGKVLESKKQDITEKSAKVKVKTRLGKFRSNPEKPMPHWQMGKSPSGQSVG